nr:hypothetical protein [Tanacetum cinerariifolium]
LIDLRLFHLSATMSIMPPPTADEASEREKEDSFFLARSLPIALKLMLFKTSRKYAKGLLLLVEDLMLLYKVVSVVQIVSAASIVVNTVSSKDKDLLKSKDPQVVSEPGSGPTWLFDIDTLTQSMNYQPVVAGNQPNSSAGIQENLTADAAAFEVKEPKSEVHVSPGSRDKTKKHVDMTKRMAKGKSHVELSTGVRNLSGEFEEFSVNSTNGVNAVNTPVTAVGPNSTNSTNSFSAAGPSNTVVSLTFKIGGKSSFMDPSHYPDDPNMPKLEDITYSDDEEDVGAEAEFFNLETSITISPIPTTRVHKDHHEEGIDYEEVFAPVARIEAIRLFLAYASFMGLCYLLKNGFQRGKIDQTLFIKKQKGDILLVHVFVDDIIFGSTNKELCKSFEKLMKDKFQMSSMGELTFFLGLQVKQKEDGIFISQDKYVAEILRKFGLTDGKSASTPIDTEKPLLKDPDVAYSDSDYAGASLDRKSTTGGCQFLSCRLIYWQCKKQTVVATSSSEVEYVAVASCCAQTSVSIKKVNDVVRLQALIDRKKVIITEDSIRQALRLDDADGVDCLPNEEIFVELARMGYEKTSTKLTFYKAFFLAQWKFLIHIILQCMSAKRTAWNVDSPLKFLMYPQFLQLMINAQFGDLSSHHTKYTSAALIKKFFANIKRIEDENNDNEVSDEPIPPSPTPATPPPSPTQAHIPLPPQAKTAQPSSLPQQPSQTAKISMTLLNTLLETCATLTKQVANLELDKVVQAIEITKLKQRVRRLEKKRQFKTSGLKRLRKVGTAQRVESSDDNGRLAESQAKVYHLDVEHVEKVLSMQDTDEVEPAEVEEVIKVVIAAKLMTEVVTTTATTITAAQVSKASALRRRKDQVKRKEKQENTVMRYQALKRKRMTYTDIRPIFEKHYNSIQAFLKKGEKEITEQEKGSKRKDASLEQRATKKYRIDEEEEELKRHL